YTLQPDEVARRVRDLGFSADVLPGFQPTTAQTMYPENIKPAWQDALAQLIQAESLASNIPSSETAFVAVRQEAGQRVTRAVPVANALAEGWSDEFAGGPRVLSAQPAAFSMAAFSPRGRGFVESQLAAASPSLMAQAMPAPSMRSRKAGAGGTALLYKGALGGLVQAQVLLDTRERADALPASVTLTAVTWSGDASQQVLADLGDLTLAIYVGDMAVARASVRLRDLAA